MSIPQIKALRLVAAGTEIGISWRVKAQTIKALESRGLIYWAGVGWRLTDVGRAALG